MFVLSALPLEVVDASESEYLQPWWRFDDGQWCMRRGSGGDGHCLPADMQLERVDLGYGQLSFRRAELLAPPISVVFRKYESTLDPINELAGDAYVQISSENVGDFLVLSFERRDSARTQGIPVTLIVVDPEHVLVVTSYEQELVAGTVRAFLEPS